MMRLVFITSFLSYLLPIDLPSQKEGDQWVIGYSVSVNPNYSLMFLDFRSGNLTINWKHDLRGYMFATNASICDANGHPIIWTNGMEIIGRNGHIIEDTIAYDGDPFLGYWIYYYNDNFVNRPFGFPKHDGALILPVPSSDNEYSVLYHSAERHPLGYFQVSKYLEARVRINGDSSYSVLYKDKLFAPHHQWYTDHTEAVRHANGRDWWVVAFEENTAKYYVFLLDPLGIRLLHENEVDIPVKVGLGQSTFSNLGNYLARIDAVTFDEGQYITLYSFDRCQGVLERMETFHTEASLYCGVAFSPSERYLYADIKTHLWQWDLWADDIAASQTLVDTFDGFVQPGWFGMRFGPMMTAPDGRIYIVPPAGSSEFMHVIDRPDLPADQCKFLQHHIDLTVPNGRSAPNIPNFRLGPLDGSPCDTLGLDNHPVARWRYEEDIPGWWYTLRFTDLSFYDPDTWHWDFDDGSTSDEMSPVHTFEPGIYHVCLTVSNTFSSDSSCRWIEILTTSHKEDLDRQPDLSINPNPFQDQLIIRSRSGTFRKAHIQLYDMHGRSVLDEFDAPVPVTIQLPSVPPGMYLCVIRERDGTMVSEKLMKM